MGFNGWQNHGHKGLEIKAGQKNYIDLFVLQSTIDKQKLRLEKLWEI
jgi:hypothetical protein